MPHTAVDVLECDDTDEALAQRVRRGDSDAFEELYRRHWGVATSMARRFLGSHQDAEDAVSDAFTDLFSALRRQAGPRELFRPYLLVCVRNSCLQRIRRSKQACSRARVLVDTEPLEDDRIVENAVVAAAFHSMPARWQSALWMAEVQQLDPVTIAERLDVKAAAAGALVYRARQRFTEAYLAQHLSHAGRPECAALAPKLARYVRGTAGLMASRQISNHLEGCPACRAAIAELDDINASLRSLTPPWALMTAAGAATAAVSGGAGAGVVSLGWLATIGVSVVVATTPLLLGSDASHAATGISNVPATVEQNTHATQPGGPRTDPGDGAIVDGGPSDELPPPTVPTVGDLTPGQSATADPLPGSPAALPTPPTGSVAGVGVSPPTLPVLVDTTLAATPVIHLPPVTVPMTTVPQVTVPPVTVPEATVPPIAVPQVTVPTVTVPQVTAPPITVPQVTAPPITVPQVTVPSVTVPEATAPPITVPQVTVPPITVPEVTIPPITVPDTTVPSVPVPPGAPGLGGNRIS